jgi:2-oxoglutarate ferredoxin oxidoreductase subunit gamma
MAREEVGHIMVANVVALGAICSLTGIVPLDILTDAVLARAPKGTEDRNKKALDIGYEAAAKLKK